MMSSGWHQDNIWIISRYTSISKIPSSIPNVNDIEEQVPVFVSTALYKLNTDDNIYYYISTTVQPLLSTVNINGECTRFENRWRHLPSEERLKYFRSRDNSSVGEIHRRTTICNKNRQKICQELLYEPVYKALLCSLYMLSW